VVGLDDFSIETTYCISAPHKDKYYDSLVLDILFLDMNAFFRCLQKK